MIGKIICSKSLKLPFFNQEVVPLAQRQLRPFVTVEMQPQRLEDAALGPGPVEEFVGRSYPVVSIIVNRHVIQVMYSLTHYYNPGIYSEVS